MKTFEEGDKVTHPLHGTGTVFHVYENVRLVEVTFEATAECGEFTTAVHPVSLNKL